MTMLQVNGLAMHVQQLAPEFPAPSDGPPSPGGPPPGSGGSAPADAAAGVGAPAPTAVLIHGTATDSMASWYLTLARPLAEAGFRVVMYDLRGHGHSERPPSGYRLDDFVDDLAGLLHELAVTGPVYLLGNSLGGTIAFGYAVRHPERVAAVVTIESSPPTPEWMRRISRRMATLAARLPEEDALAEIGARRGQGAARRAEAVRELLAATTIARELPASPPPDTAALARVTCPVLCLFGGDSAVAELAPEVEALLPQACTAVVPGQGHTLLIRAPQTVRDLVLPWLGEQAETYRTHEAYRTHPALHRDQPAVPL